MAPQKKNIAPIKLELLMAIVPNSKQAFYSSLIQSQQANLQFTLPCKGTTHLILNYLGLAEKPKSLVMSVIRADEAPEIFARLKEQFQRGGEYKGVAFSVPFSSMVGTLSYGFLSNVKQVQDL
jgi:hypothetical protein